MAILTCVLELAIFGGQIYSHGLKLMKPQRHLTTGYEEKINFDS